MIKPLGCIFTLWLLSQIVLAADPSHDWKTLSTDHFEINYPDTLVHLVDEVARESERAHRQLAPYFKWVPENKTQVVMVDDYDTPNGSATPLPRNTITLIMQPPTAGSLVDYDSWLRLLIVHEYTHILHIDKVIDWPDTLRNIFGRLIVLFPNALHPNWFQEGLATYIESDEEGGTGRGQSDYFQMMMRQEVITGLESLYETSTVYSREWPLNHVYLYGVYFMQFIIDRYGEAALLKMIDDYSDNLVPFRIDSNPIGATGKPLTNLWTEFALYLKEKFANQISRIERQGVSTPKRLVERGISYQSPRLGSHGDIWFTGTDGYQASKLYRYQKGKAEAQVELTSAGNIDVSDEGMVVISQLQNCGNHKLYYDLYLYDPIQDDKSLKRITKCGRYPYVKWHQGNLVAVQYEGAKARLVTLDIEGTQINTIWDGQYGDVLSAFDINEQGIIIAAIKPQGQSWDLYQISGAQIDQLTQDGNIESTPNWEGNELYFVKSGQGQKEVYVWRWSQELKGFNSEEQRLTNMLSGVEEVVSLNQDSLLITEYTDKGSRISTVKKTLSFTPLQTEQTLTYLEAQPVSAETNDYRPLNTLWPTWWAPVANISAERNELGIYTFGNDAAGFHNYVAQLTYESEYSQFFPNISYSYDGRLLLNYSTSMSELLELDSGERLASYEIDRSIAYFVPFLSVENNWYGYGAYINSTAEIISTEGRNINWVVDGHSQLRLYDDWLAAGIIYDSRGTSLLQGDSSRGTLTQLGVESASVFNNDISDGEVTILDIRNYLGFNDDKHTFAQRFVLGIGEDSTTNFELGGTFSDQNFGPSVNLNKRSFALRGYEESDANLSDDNMLLYSAEIRLPYNWDQRSSISPPIGYLGSSIRFFAEAGTVWAESEDPEKAYSAAGAEWVLDTTLGYFLLFQLHLGVAHGFNEGGINTIYLEAGGAF